MTVSDGPATDPTTDATIDPTTDASIDQADVLAAESALLDEEDVEFDQLDDTTDGVGVEEVQPVEGVDVEADVARFGPAPVGPKLTPEETAVIEQQVAATVAANQTRGAADQVSVAPEDVN
jgi:hypothetical protein